eukprot:3697674-Pyramimonas_sp.AAC.1
MARPTQLPNHPCTLREPAADHPATILEPYRNHACTMCEPPIPPVVHPAQLAQHLRAAQEKNAHRTDPAWPSTARSATLAPSADTVHSVRNHTKDEGSCNHKVHSSSHSAFRKRCIVTQVWYPYAPLHSRAE